MMFTPWGPRAVPTGGAGVAAPACSCTLTRAATFFLGGISFFFLSCGHDGGLVPLPLLLQLRNPTQVSRRVTHFASLSTSTLLNLFGIRDRSEAPVTASDLLDLTEAQLDRSLPAEDLDERLDPLRLGIDLGDRRVQRGERPVHNHDRVGDVEVGDLDRLAGGRGAARGRGPGSNRGRLGG